MSEPFDRLKRAAVEFARDGLPPDLLKARLVQIRREIELDDAARAWASLFGSCPVGQPDDTHREEVELHWAAIEFARPCSFTSAADVLRIVQALDRAALQFAASVAGGGA